MFFAIAVAIAGATTPDHPQIFVSPIGKDSNSGRTWAASVATLQKAIELSAGQANTIRIRGTIRIQSPILIDRASGLKVVGEKDARILGSVRVQNWKSDEFNGIPVFSAKWSLQIPPYEMFAGTRRAEQTRLPSKGFFQFARVDGGNAAYNVGQDEAGFNPSDIPNLSHPEDAEVVVHQLWVTSRLPIARLDSTRHVFGFTKKSVFKLNDSHSDQPSNYYVENVGEALKTPGQWYWNASSSTIHYVPRPGERPNSFSAEIPMVPSILTVSRSSNVEIQNLEFSGSEFRYPASLSGDGQAATSVPAAVEVVDSHNCLFQNDTVSGAGTYGFEVSGSSQGNRFQHCRVEDVGAGGVKVGHGTSATSITDCSLTHLGKIYASAVGIWIGNSGHNRVSHCLIEDAGYTGISVGWTWGYGKSDAVDNLIESNLIRDLGHGELSDMGGIYTLGVSPGTVLRHNRIDHVRCTYYGGWGIYLDEGSSNILVEDNLVTDCQTGNFHQHYGADNLIRNNIFGFAPTVGQVIRTRTEEHTSFTMEQNLFEWEGTPLFAGNLAGTGIVFHNNLLWPNATKLDLPAFASADNTVVNPRFLNSDKRNFNLPQDSPAFAIGFKPFSLKDFGPRY